MPGDFAEMVGKKTVQKFSVTARQVILYLGDVKPGDVLNFEYTPEAEVSDAGQDAGDRGV